MKGLYETLGVEKTASSDEIRKAYHKLARKYHPDVNPGDAAAADRFKEVAAAYDVLSDDGKRKAYDEFGDDSLRQGFDPDKARAYRQWQQGRQRSGMPFEQEVVDFGDLGDLFGGFRRRGPRKGTDVHGTIELDLAQAIRGTQVTFEVPLERGVDKVAVRIPPGADDGSTLRIAGKGGPGAGGGPRGDLVITTRVRKHPMIERDGLDLSMHVPITLDEAYSGASIEIPTFDGNIKVKVPARSQTGTKLRLKGKGVQRGKQRGDLFVVMSVRMPDRDDEQLAEALKRASELYGEPVRKDMRL